MSTLEQDLNTLGQTAPHRRAMEQAVQQHLAGAQKWNATIKSVKPAVKRLVADAPWLAVSVAHDAVTAGLTAWTERDMVPIIGWHSRGFQARFCAAIVLPLALLWATVHYCSLAWLVVAGPAAWKLMLWFLESADDARLAYIKRREYATYRVYDRIRCIQQELGLSHPRYVVPAILQMLAQRYTAEQHLHTAEAIKAANHAAWLREIAQRPGNSTSRRSNHYAAGAGAGAVAGAVMLDTATYSSGSDDTVQQQVWDTPATTYDYDQHDDMSHIADVNPANGMPMIDGTFDVSGHVFGDC